MTEVERRILDRFENLEITFNERSRRVWAAAEALSAGRGGVSAVSRVTGISRTTIYQGIKELENRDEPGVPTGRTRKPGGGRKKIIRCRPRAAR